MTLYKKYMRNRLDEGGDLAKAERDKNLSGAIGFVSTLGAGIIDATAKPDAYSGRTSTGATVGKAALSGASAGAQLGPIGAGVGAVIGAGMGFLQAGKEKKEAKRVLEEDLRNTEMANASRSSARLATNPSLLDGFKGASYFANGGNMTGDPDKPYHPKNNPDGYKGNKPIKVTNPNDPRLRAYNDSLTLYKATKDDIRKLKTMSAQDWWDYANAWDKNNPKAVPAATRLAKMNGKRPMPVETYTPQYREGDTALIYKEPVQPYKYVAEEQPPIIKPVANLRFQGKDMSTGANPQVAAPNLQRAEYDIKRPTNFVYTNASEKFLDQQNSYFPDEQSLRAFAAEQNTSSITTTKKGASATGYLKKADGGDLKAPLATMFMTGGNAKTLSSDNTVLEGKTHAQGGIKIPEMGAEVEDGETTKGSYVFSEKLGFAQIHKKIATAKGKIEGKPPTHERITSMKRLEAKENDLMLAQEYIKNQMQ